MTTPAQQVVQKLWKFCNVLRDDGLSYPDYVEQLTYLLFLKMADERSKDTGASAAFVPDDLGWDSLLQRRGADQHAHYAYILSQLGKQSGMLGLIFRRAQNKIQDPAKLQKLIVDLVNKETWTDLDSDVKGDAYEGLLDKTSQDSKSGAGQYFTLRALVDAIVEVVRPLPGETICDPACGTGGFLLSACAFIRRTNPSLTPEQEKHLRLKAIRGVELVDSVARLGAMNLLLHGIGPLLDEADTPITVEDSITNPPREQFDVVLTNPPFGKKSSMTVMSEDDALDFDGLATARPEFFVTTANKQLNFLQHVYAILKPGGRAAVVVPDNVLFERGAAEVVRRRLLEECDVHTLLRLPTGIFYAQGVKANVLFFDKLTKEDCSRRKNLWVFDLRSHVKYSLRTKPLKREDIEEFVICYSASDRDARKTTKTRDTVPDRWRCFTYEELLARDGLRLDIDWLEDGEADARSQVSPRELGAEIMEDLKLALAEIEAVTDSLS
ncbi:MAG: methylase [Chthonomonadaceae bacterium]|nr:methylase [Chthonomonadaceae bacterium]